MFRKPVLFCLISREQSISSREEFFVMKILAVIIFINIFVWNALAAKPVAKPPAFFRDQRIDPLEEDEVFKLLQF